ncbi:DUF397 domain-containing protein [Actinophytocola sediminis]
MNGYDPTTIDVFPADGWSSAKFCGPNGGNCVEVNLGTRGAVGLRDSKSAGGPALAFTEVGWGRFLDAAKAGQLVRE